MDFSTDTDKVVLLQPSLLGELVGKLKEDIPKSSSVRARLDEYPSRLTTPDFMLHGVTKFSRLSVLDYTVTVEKSRVA